MNTSRNILMTLTRHALGIGLRLGSTVVIARALGPADNGRYALALLLPTLLAAALNLGIPAANARYVASRTLRLSQAFRMNIAPWVALSAVGVLGLWLLQRTRVTWFSELPHGALLLACALIPIMLASAFAAGLLQGVGDFARYNVGLFIAPLIAAGVALALALASQLDVVRALGVQLTAELASLMYLLSALRAQLQARRFEPHQAEAPSLRALLTFGGLAHVSTLLMLLNYRTDLLMLEWLIGPAAVGVYVIAARVAEQLWIVSHAMSSVLLPELSSQNASDARAAYITSALRTALWAGGALALAMALLHPLILALFGPSYRPAAVPLLWLLPGAALLGGARIAGVAMTALGRPERNLAIALAVLICNVPLNLLLIPRYGASGAACATSLSYALGCAVALGMLRALSPAPLGRFLVPTFDDLQRGKRILRELVHKP